MSREDFMRRLEELLADVSSAERDEAIQYYNDYFDDAGAENEQNVITALGSPEQLAGSIKAGLADGGSSGEFTEKGFQAYEQKKSDEVLDISKPQGAAQDSGSTQDGSNGWRQGNAHNENDAWRQGNAQNGNDAWRQGNAQNGNDAWQQGNAQNGNDAWRQENAQNGNDAWQQENAQNENNAWQQGNTQNENDARYAGGSNSGNYYTSYEGNTSQEQNKKLSGGMIALIVILCIFASPFLLGLGGGVLGIIIGIFGALFGIVVGVGAAALALIVTGVCLFAYGITLLFGLTLGGLTMMGVGMILTAVGLLLLWLTVIICGMLIPALIRGIVNLFNSIFNKGGARA